MGRSTSTNKAHGTSGLLMLVVCLACVFFLPQTAIAQHFLTHVHTTEAGLIQSQATAIYQDKEGYLWVGTQGGLSQFDGLFFENYSVEEGLLSNRIFTLGQDHEERLWIGTSMGINIMAGDSLLAYSTDNGLLDNNINALLHAPDSSTWIASQSGISLFKDGVFTHFTTEEGLAGPSVRALAYSPGGTLWFGTNNGICQKTHTLLTCYTTDNGLPNPLINDILIDSKDRIWAATPSGIAQYIPSTDRFVTLAGLPITGATSLLEDRSGGYWIGSRTGVIRLDSTAALTHSWQNGEWIAQTLYEDREGNIWAGTSGRGIIQFRQTAFSHLNPLLNLPQDVYLGMAEDDQNRLWIGTMLHGVYLIDGTNVQQLNQSVNPLLQHVRTVVQDQEGNMLFGTASGLAHYDGTTFTNYTTQQGLVHPYVYTILPASDGSIWIGTNGGLNVLRNGDMSIIELDLGSAIPTVQSLYEDVTGRIWIGTAHGLLVYEAGKINAVKPLKNHRISTILSDGKGRLLLGTLGHGVLLLDPSTRAVVDTINMKHGLNSSTVYFTEFDKSGDLWIGTSMGVNHLSMEPYHFLGQKSIRSFNGDDGIVGIETNMNASILTQKSELWFGTIKGLMQYDATSRPENTVPPLIHLDAIRLFHESTDLRHHSQFKHGSSSTSILTLPHDKNHLSFDFKALSLTNPKQVRYQYRLQGFDDDWSPETKDRSAVYANLEPGSYIFEVRARNGNGIWSISSATLPFQINAPFWQTSWFILLSIGLTLLGIWGIILIRTRRLEKKQRLLEDMVRTRTQALEHTHQQLLEAREEALAAARAKSAFMSTMTHELRTPMNGILGMTQVLGTTHLDRDQQECMQSILTCSTEMVALIENMLTFADLATGKRNIQILPFHLEHLLQESINNLSSQICAKDMEIRYFISPSLPDQIEADREHLRQILQHLLSNAVKFTESGIVYIEVLMHRPSPAAQPQHQHQLLISVHDTGIGMDKDDLKRIFEPFSQADMSLTRRYSGVGIGLALAQQLTALLGGKLSAESWPGIGSSFSFTLPIPTLQLQTRPHHPGNDPLLAKRVLIATSTPQERRRLSLLCRSLGMRTGTIAPASENALLASTGADIIITDKIDYLVDAASYETATIWVCEDDGMNLDHAFILPQHPCREQIKEMMLEALSGEKTE